MKKQENAYFTVEAAMVMPIVIFTIVMLVYLLFFQYNRCLMEQDMGALALKGCSIQEDDKEALMQTLGYYANKTDKDKYVMWNMNDAEIKLETDKIEVLQKGGLIFPFSGFMKEVDTRWDTVAVYKNQRINPVDFIRMYSKLTGGR